MYMDTQMLQLLSPETGNIWRYPDNKVILTYLNIRANNRHRCSFTERKELNNFDPEPYKAILRLILSKM